MEIGSFKCSLVTNATRQSPYKIKAILDQKFIFQIASNLRSPPPPERKDVSLIC